jgi:hypothetical protein
MPKTNQSSTFPGKLGHREDPLAAIEKAKAEIERPAREGFGAENAKHEEKVKRRQDALESRQR